MPRLIDADALKTELCTNTSVGTYMDCVDGSDVYFTSREVDRVIDAAPTIDPVKWVSVGERLPTDGGFVLAYNGFVMRMSQYFGEGWTVLDVVTHWMPLPEPPKMDGDAHD